MFPILAATLTCLLPHTAHTALSDTTPMLVAKGGKGEVVQDPAWPFTFRSPRGWVHRKGEQGAILGHKTIPGMILVSPSPINTTKLLIQSLEQGYSDPNVQLGLVGTLEKKGDRQYAGDYRGTAKGNTVYGRIVGTVSNNSSGAVYIIAIFADGEKSRKIFESVDELAGSIRFSRGINAAKRQLVGGPDWGYQFKAPLGWKYSSSGQGFVLQSSSVQGVILVMVHHEKSKQALLQSLSQGVQDKSITLSLQSRLAEYGNNGVFGVFTGHMGGHPMRASIISTLSPHGGGVSIISMAAPNSFGEPLEAATKDLVDTLVYFKIPGPSPELIRHFAGNWEQLNTSRERTMWLGEDGAYSSRSTSLFVQGVTDYQMGFTAGSSSKSEGRWTIKGDKTKGVLRVVKEDGTYDYNYRVYVEKGKTFWNQYYLEDQFWVKK